jgi:hypothetical protein
MAFGRDKIKNDLKKAIYKAIAKAYKQNIPFVKEAVDKVGKEHAVNHIIADLDDENNVAQVPENHIPVDKDNVLHKDIPSVKEMHDAKEAQAKAKMGMMPLEGQKGAVYMAEQPSKGVQKLKKFMGEREIKMGKTSQHEKGVHHPTPKTNKDSGESLTGHYARKGDSLASIYDHESGKEIASSLHHEKLNELKRMPKPNLGKAKVDESMSPKEKSYARWKRGGDQTEGVHTAPFKSVPGMSTSGYEIELSGHPTEAAKQSHKRVLSELKQMPKPNLGKAKIDEGYMAPKKRKMRQTRGNEMFGRPEFAAGDPRHDRIKAIHAPAVSYEKDYMGEEIPSQSEAGRALMHGDAEKAKQMHREKLAEMQSMPKPNLGKAVQPAKVHGVPGVNRDLHARGVNDAVSVAMPSAAGDAKEKSLQGLRTRRGDIAGAKEAARGTLSELKQMPKPNLGKSSNVTPRKWKK